MAYTRFFLDKRNAQDGKPCVLKIVIVYKTKTALISLDAKLFTKFVDGHQILLTLKLT